MDVEEYDSNDGFNDEESSRKGIIVMTNISLRVSLNLKHTKIDSLKTIFDHEQKKIESKSFN